MEGPSSGANHVLKQSSMCMNFDSPVQAMQLSGKSQFPYMVDPNNGTSMLESDNIINYLWQVGSPLQHMMSGTLGVHCCAGRVICGVQQQL